MSQLAEVRKNSVSKDELKGILKEVICHAMPCCAALRHTAGNGQVSHIESLVLKTKTLGTTAKKECGHISVGMN